MNKSLLLLVSLFCVSALFTLACVTPQGTGEGGSETSSGESTKQASESKGGTGDVLHIQGDEHFQKEVLEYEGVVLVDVTAGWCPPCKRLSPHIDKLASEYADKLKIVKVYEDDKGKPNSGILTKYKIRAFPTLIIFKSGDEVAREMGYRDYNALKNWVDEHI